MLMSICRFTATPTGEISQCLYHAVRTPNSSAKASPVAANIINQLILNQWLPLVDFRKQLAYRNRLDALVEIMNKLYAKTEFIARMIKQTRHRAYIRIRLEIDAVRRITRWYFRLNIACLRQQSGINHKCPRRHTSHLTAHILIAILHALALYPKMIQP